MAIKMKGTMSPAVLLAKESGQKAVLTIENTGDEVIILGSTIAVGEQSDGILLLIPWGSKETDLTEHIESEKIVLTPLDALWTAERVLGPPILNVSQWNIYPKEKKELKPGENIGIRLTNVTGNGISGKSVLQMVLHNRAAQYDFETIWEKIEAPEIELFDAEVKKRSQKKVLEFLDPDIILSEETTMFSIRPYAWPPDPPSPGPTPPPPEFRTISITWKAKNTESCTIVYGSGIKNVNAEGCCDISMQKSIHEITLNAYAREHIVQISKTAVIRQ